MAVLRNRLPPLVSLVIVAAACVVPPRAAEAQRPAFVFRDVAQETGLSDAVRGMMGHAAAWGDVNGDGRWDLFVGTFADRPVENYVAGGAKGPVPNQLLIQRDGRFVSAGQKALAHRGRASGSVFADFDNDGLPELYVSNNGRLGKENLLYHNQGEGKFSLVNSAAGAPVHLPEVARGAAVLDFDGDGLLDLIVLSTLRRGKTLLFRNRGKMKFELSDAIPGDAVGLGVACGDLTGNGWPDVFIGGSNRLFVNTGGKFREAAEFPYRLEFTREDGAGSCGVAFGDFDRDGQMDILTGSHEKSPWRQPNAIRLFKNAGSTAKRVRFEEVTKAVGVVKYPLRVPHVEMRDFDNDGWPDLYTSLVVLKDEKIYPAVYRNLGSRGGELPKFEETAIKHRPDFPGPKDYVPSEGTLQFYDRLVANRKLMYFAPGPSADYDNDGRLDLFLPSWFPKFPSLLLRNETPSGHYLDVTVEGSDGINRMGVGCVVRAYLPGKAAATAALLASEEIATGYGYCSGQPAMAHLGLGKHATCDLVITLPHGKGQITRKNVKANQRLKITAGK